MVFNNNLKINLHDRTPEECVAEFDDQKIPIVITHTPKYVTEQIGGPSHAPEFRAKVLVEGREKGEGKGKNKKEAEKAAAEDALAKWKNQIY